EEGHAGDRHAGRFRRAERRLLYDRRRPDQTSGVVADGGERLRRLWRRRIHSACAAAFAGESVVVAGGGIRRLSSVPTGGCTAAGLRGRLRDAVRRARLWTRLGVAKP